MSDRTTSLSPHHERVGAAHIRAGDIRRGARPCASRRPRDPGSEAAIAELKLSNHSKPEHPVRLKHRRRRLEFGTAHQAPRAGMAELELSNHSKPVHPLTLNTLTRTPAARPWRDLRHHRQAALHDRVVVRAERQPQHGCVVYDLRRRVFQSVRTS